MTTEDGLTSTERRAILAKERPTPPGSSDRVNTGRSPQYTCPKTPVAKAFFDTTVGRRLVSGLVVFGAIGTVAGTSLGTPVLAGFSSMLLLSAAFRRFAPRDELSSNTTQLVAACGIAALSMIVAVPAAIRVHKDNEKIARMAAQPDSDERKIILLTRKEFECHDKPKGALISLPSGKNLTCG